MPNNLVVFQSAKPVPLPPSERSNPDLDAKRVLSPKGRRQAGMRRARLGNPLFDLVVCAPTMRAFETAKIMTGKEPAIIQALSPYAWDVSQHSAVGLTLKDYCGNGGETVEELAAAAWKQIEMLVKDQKATRIFVACDGLLATALPIEAARHDPHVEHKLMQTSLKNAEGLCVTFSDTAITGVTLYQ